MVNNYFLLASSLALLSLFAIAYADGYGYDTPVSTPKSTYTPSPSYKSPAPEYTPDHAYSSPPSTIYKSPVYTPSPEYKKPVYTPIPAYTAKQTYTGYSAEKEKPTIYGVQGIIYCRYGYDLTPLKGATAKIACMAKGYKPASFSLVTPETDDNGYFLATFTPKELGDHLKPKNCKVYFNSSPSKSCNIATDVGKGISGAPLTYSRVIHNYMNMYNMELYSVSPFVYKTPASTYTPKSTYNAPRYTPQAEYKKPIPETSTYTPSPSGY